MPRLLLLLPATTYRVEAFLAAARRLNLDVTVASDGATILKAQRPTDFLYLNFRDPDEASRAVVSIARQSPIDAVIGVDEPTTVLAAHLSVALNLPHNDVASVSAARNKHLMRQLLRRHHVPVPNFAVFPHTAAPASLVGQIAFPCVVKPLILSASCGVIRADNPAEFDAAFRRVSALLTTLGLTALDEAGRLILVEDFVPGCEVALEGLLTAGTLRVLALFDKPDPLDGPFFEETIYITPSRLPDQTQQAIAACAQSAARALGLCEGPVHGEFRINDGGVWVVELAARSIGGQCSRTVHFAADLSLEELILRHALRLPLPSLERAAGAAGVMMMPIPSRGALQEVRGQDDARRVPGIEALTITATPGEELVPLPEGTRYLGFLVARGATPDAVESALREAHRRLTVVLHAESAGERPLPPPARPGVMTF